MVRCAKGHSEDLARAAECPRYKIVQGGGIDWAHGTGRTYRFRVLKGQGRGSKAISLASSTDNHSRTVVWKSRQLCPARPCWEFGPSFQPPSSWKSQVQTGRTCLSARVHCCAQTPLVEGFQVGMWQSRRCRLAQGGRTYLLWPGHQHERVWEGTASLEVASLPRGSPFNTSRVETPRKDRP